MSIFVVFKGFDLEVEVTYYYPGTDAVIDKLPEDCIPAEEAEVDWTYPDIHPLFETLLGDHEDELKDIVLEYMAENQEEPEPPENDDDFMENW